MNFNATIIGQTITFILFVLFCMKYIWPLLITAIEKRQKEIAENLASVKKAKKDLHLMKVNAENQIKIAREEAKIIIDYANKRYEQILNEARIKAEQEHSKIIEQAQVKISAERKRVFEELRKQISILVIDSTEKIIQHSISEVIDRDIIDKIIDELYKKRF